MKAGDIWARCYTTTPQAWELLSDQILEQTRQNAERTAREQGLDVALSPTHTVLHEAAHTTEDENGETFVLPARVLVCYEGVVQ